MEANLDIQILDRPVLMEPLEKVPQPSGAEAIFIGRTRRERHDKHGELVELSYEAYRPMALRVLHDLARRAAERFGCRFVRVHHALGVVPPGEGSVLVQVVTGHRGEAFDACRWLIDRLKTEAPIWKREIWDDGTTWATGRPIMADSSTPESSESVAS